jgi:hypothetical protein
MSGVKAEVYPVATNGPWKENYSYFPGEITELNLRIAGQQSVGQTREPTPVQTRLPASAVEAFLPEPGIATGRPVMGGPVNPPAAGNPREQPRGRKCREIILYLSVDRLLRDPPAAHQS